MLRQLADYVYDSGRPLAAGHTMNPLGSLTGETREAGAGGPGLVAMAFADDSELPGIDTPYGRLEFVQVVGLTRDEYEAAREWHTSRFLALLVERVPMLVTDPDRPSILADHEIAAHVADRIAAEGSSTAQVSTTAVDWAVTAGGTTVLLDEDHRANLARRLAGRLRFGQELTIVTPYAVAVFQTGAEFRADEEDDELTVTVPAESVDGLVAAVASPGRQPVAGIPGLVFDAM